MAHRAGSYVILLPSSTLAVFLLIKLQTDDMFAGLLTLVPVVQYI